MNSNLLLVVFCSAYVEVIGKVAGNGNHIEAIRVIDAGNEVDLAMHNKVVELANGKYRPIFA